MDSNKFGNNLLKEENTMVPSTGNNSNTKNDIDDFLNEYLVFNNMKENQPPLNQIVSNAKKSCTTIQTMFQNQINCETIKYSEENLKNFYPNFISNVCKSTKEIDNEFTILPPLIKNNKRVSIDDLKLRDLRHFVPLALRLTTLRKPEWENQMCKPSWWPDDIPFKNVRKDWRSPAEKKASPFAEKLKKALRNCYAFYKCEHLLNSNEYPTNNSINIVNIEKTTNENSYEENSINTTDILNELLQAYPEQTDSQEIIKYNNIIEEIFNSEPVNMETQNIKTEESEKIIDFESSFDAFDSTKVENTKDVTDIHSIYVELLDSTKNKEINNKTQDENIKTFCKNNFSSYATKIVTNQKKLEKNTNTNKDLSILKCPKSNKEFNRETKTYSIEHSEVNNLERKTDLNLQSEMENEIEIILTDVLDLENNVSSLQSKESEKINEIYKTIVEECETITKKKKLLTYDEMLFHSVSLEQRSVNYAIRYEESSDLLIPVEDDNNNSEDHLEFAKIIADFFSSENSLNLCINNTEAEDNKNADDNVVYLNYSKDI